VLGIINPDLNTNRLRVAVPIEGLATAPYRLSYGGGVGTALTLTVVDEFGLPAQGTVEVLRSTGHLNWNPQDLVDLEWQIVRFQQQYFYDYTQSDGFLGFVSEAGDQQNSPLMLNPIPATGQFPVLRFGYGIWLTPIEVASFNGTIDPGTFQWIPGTGALKFNSDDLTKFADNSIYYDGVFIQYGISLPRYFSQPSPTGTLPFTPLPSEGGDLIFYYPEDTNKYQIPTVKWVDDFEWFQPPGVVQIKRSNGEYEIAGNPGTTLAGPLCIMSGDLPIEHGVGVRFYRNIINPQGDRGRRGDVSIYWKQVGDDRGVLAFPITQTPYVNMPSRPIEDETNFPTTVKVEQGAGLFTGTLPSLNRFSEAFLQNGLGHILSYGDGRVYYAQRTITKIPLTYLNSTFQLPDPLIFPPYYQFSIGASPTSEEQLVEGESFLLDPTPGMLTLINLSGKVVGSGNQGTLFVRTFIDSSNSVNVLSGDVLVVYGGGAEGVYRLQAGNIQQGVLTDLDADHLVDPAETGLIYEIRRSPEVVADSVWNSVTFPDPNTRVERIRYLGTQPSLVTLHNGNNATLEVSLLTDNTADFVGLGVLPGDTLRLSTDLSYRILDVGTTHLSFSGVVTETTSTTYQVYRRLSLPAVDVELTRFRFGRESFTQQGQLTTVNRDSDFNPNLAVGQVQISLETGNLNFSAANVPEANPPDVYVVVEVLQGVGYTMNPALSFIEFKERMLTGEEILVRYVPLDDQGQKLDPIEEQASFEIFKELTYPTPRSEPTNVVSFNPTGKTVAIDPAPKVYRGSRPQTSTQVDVDLSQSKVTFKAFDGPPPPANSVNPWPKEATLEPDERVWVEYSVYEAMGGESNITLRKTPYVAPLRITEDANNIVVEGDHTSVLPDGYLFRVGQTDVYQVATTSYDAATDLTTFELEDGESFNDNLLNPAFYVISNNPTQTTFRGGLFLDEAARYQTVARGMTRIKVEGDRTTVYQNGTLLLFQKQDQEVPYKDYYTVISSRYLNGWTEIFVGSAARRQYIHGTDVLRVSARPVQEEGVSTSRTSQTPVLSRPYGAFRKIAGQPGQLTTDYSIDASGVVNYNPPLGAGEEIALWYTGNRYAEKDTSLKCQYTNGVVPNTLTDPKPNNMLNQVLTMEYSIWSPDTFYFRVETMTNFLAETTQYFRTQAQGSSPGGGPRTSNAPSSPGLAGQGRESIFYAERHISNMDEVAVKFLKFVNDNINHLEDALEDMDGRIVGAYQGRFKFDGQTNNPKRETLAEVTNEVDDLVYLEDRFTFFPLTEKYYAPMWASHKFSRLYPTFKDSLFGTTSAGHDTPNIANYTPIMNLGVGGIQSVSGDLFRRYPRGRVTEGYSAHTNTFTLDNANGIPSKFRPSFKQGMRVDFLKPDGTSLIPSGTYKIAEDPTNSTDIKLNTAIPVPVPRDTTVTLHKEDDSYKKSYSTIFDVSLENESGIVYYTTPWFGDLIPPPNANETLQLNNTTIRNKLTAPFRFPALDGLAESDTHDTGIPMKDRTSDCEPPLLAAESEVLAVTALDVYASDTISDVSYSGTTLSKATPWAAPVPQVNDLVRFTTGINAQDGWRRITAVNNSSAPYTLEIESGFPIHPAITTIGVQYAEKDLKFAGPMTIQLNNDLYSEPGDYVLFEYDTFTGGQTELDNNVTVVWEAGTPPSGINNVTLVDLPAQKQIILQLVSYTNDIMVTNAPDLIFGQLTVINSTTVFLTTGATPGLFKKGQTIVIEASGDRRQITQVSGNQLTLDHPIGLAPNSMSSYRINNHISTYSDYDALQIMATKVATKVQEEITSLNSFFAGVLTDLVTGSVDLSASDVLTDFSKDFVASNVQTSNFVYIETGPNRGFYAITEVTSYTLKVSPAFSSLTPSTPYRVVSAYNLPLSSLNDLFGVLDECRDWQNYTLEWLDSWSPAEDFYEAGTPNTNVYVNRVTTETLINRINNLDDRRLSILGGAGPTYRIEQVLGSRDQFYNLRYVWIDGRVNMRNGLRYLAARSATARTENLERQKNDLIKLSSLG